MYNSEMNQLGLTGSVIRAIFTYGQLRKQKIGEENVFDFSLGNPSVPAPKTVEEAILGLVHGLDSMKLHGYTAAAGDRGVRSLLAENLNERYGTAFNADNFYLTVGAAASIKATVQGLYELGDEFIAISPYFPEYRVFVETTGGKFIDVPAERPSFQIDFDALEAAITSHTKAVIINTPNNPTGVVYTEKTIQKLAALLKAKSEERGSPIFLISDEPYRELVYDQSTCVPYVTKYYADTIVCYSFSKSLSLPGERIGYVLVGNGVSDAKNVYAAICGAGRALGYVCAPSMFQHVVAACAGQTSDLSIYKENRDILYQALTTLGYECVYPDGAFYLFVKSLEENAVSFCETAKKHELLLVPADEFGCPGYVRISYCVQTDMIKRSLPAFERLAKEYQCACLEE